MWDECGRIVRYRRWLDVKASDTAEVADGCFINFKTDELVVAVCGAGRPASEKFLFITIQYV
jgi:hypothetical protein